MIDPSHLTPSEHACGSKKCASLSLWLCWLRLFCACFVLRLDPYRAFQHDTCRGCCTRAHATVSTTASSAYQKDQRQSAALPHRPTVTSTHCLALMRMDFVHPMNPLCNPRTFSYERSAFDGTCLWNHLCVKTFDRYAVPLSTGACFL